MSTVIDSLIIELGLSTKDVDAKAPGVKSKLSDIEKSAGKTEAGVKGIGTASKGTATELATLTGKLGSFLAVLGGTAAVSVFVKDTIQANTQLYFLSRNLDMSTQKLFAWGAATQELGGSKGTMQNFMRTIAAMPGELMVGKMPQILPLFARLGINMREPFDQIMVDMSKRFSGMNRRVAFSFGMASGIPEDVMNLLLQGPGAVQAAMSRTKGFGPTEKEAASAAQLKRSFTDLELQFVKIGYDLLQRVTPALEKFLSLLQSIGAWAQQHGTIVEVIAGIVAALSGAIAVTAAWIGLTAALEAAMPVIEAVGVVFGLIDLPLLAVISAIGMLTAGIVLLAQDYKTWADGGRSFFDWGAFAADIHKAVDEFKSLGEKIEAATASYASWIAARTPEPIKKAIRSAGSTVGRWFDNQLYGTEAVHRIAKLEGFYAPEGGFVPNASGKGSHWSFTAHQNVPQRANNPTDIEYGAFARDHGATGYIVAKGGKKIATFRSIADGYLAAADLLRSKPYANLTEDQRVARWQYGPNSSQFKALMGGISNASGVASSVGPSSSISTSHNDNSRTTHIGTINMQSPTGSGVMTPSLARGMDWTTLLTQQNTGLQ